MFLKYRKHQKLFPGKKRFPKSYFTQNSSVNIQEGLG